MYAIIQTGGKQYWVEQDARIQVEKVEGEPGAKLTLQALWGANESASGPKGTVTAEIVRQMRAPKILVFKKRPKKGTRKMAGHRQDMTEIRITGISLS